MNDKFDMGGRFPVRDGVATGHGNERTMADKVGCSGFRTEIRDNLDGSVTRLRTRGGALEYVTTNANSVTVPTKKTINAWSYDFMPLKLVDGAYVPDVVPISIYTVPEMTVDAGAKTRRFGLKKSGGRYMLNIMESAYDGIKDGPDDPQIAGGGFWYKDTDQVSWTTTTFVPGEPYPSLAPLGVVRYRDDTNTDRLHKNAEIGLIGPEPSTGKVMLAACIARSPDGTKYIRTAHGEATFNPLNPTKRIKVTDYDISGSFICELWVDFDGIYLAPKHVAGFSQDGLRLIVGMSPLEGSSVAKIYNVTRPNGSTIPTSSTEEYSATVVRPIPAPAESTYTVENSTPNAVDEGNLTQMAPYDFEALEHYEYTNEMTGATTVAVDTAYTPRHTNTVARTTTTIVDATSSADIWAEAVGFSPWGAPCVAIATESVAVRISTTDISDVGVEVTYGAKRIRDEHIQILGAINYKRWVICDDYVSDSLSDHSIDRTTTRTVRRTLDLTVNGDSLWGDVKSFVSVSPYTYFTRSVSTTHFSYDNGSFIRTDTTRSENNVSSSDTQRSSYITLDTIACDFADGIFSVFSHDVVAGQDVVHTTSYHHDNGNVYMHNVVTGENTFTPFDNTSSSDITVPPTTPPPPDTIQATITVFDMSAGGVIADYRFPWNGDGLSGYRSVFSGCGAWDYKTQSLLAMNMWPTATHCGHFFKKGSGWAPVVLNPAEPASLGSFHSELFALRNLSPFI